MLGVQEKAETDTGPELAGKDRGVTEKEGATAEAVDMGEAQAEGMGRVGPGG